MLDFRGFKTHLPPYRDLERLPPTPKSYTQVYSWIFFPNPSCKVFLACFQLTWLLNLLMIVPIVGPSNLLAWCSSRDLFSCSYRFKCFGEPLPAPPPPSPPPVWPTLSLVSSSLAQSPRNLSAPWISIKSSNYQNQPLIRAMKSWWAARIENNK